MADALRLAVDVGGTFTDIVVLKADGTAIPKKVLSSPPAFSVAIRQGVEAVIAENGLEAGRVGKYVHGATVATNAIITRTGARTGLITTKGFRDVLEIRRMRMPKLYDITWEKPKPLIPRNLRREVAVRTDPRSGESTPLDEGELADVVERLMREGIESLAICFLHSYEDGSGERQTREVVRRLAPQWSISLSSEVLPEIKEYERTSTTVINAYVQPVVERYGRAMERDLAEIGIGVPIMVMQSNGGMMPMSLACEFPVHIIESGPAAGVTGAFHLAMRMGLENVITLDMGGTTAKAAMIEDGEISRSPEYEVGGEISVGHRLMKGSGYLMRIPSIDLAEVGAGGGSIAWTDAAGALKVGPQSTGANPGPACYATGGADPTITDANVHLGLTNPESLAGGTLPIRRDLAERAIVDKVASRLGLDLTETAWGIREIANSSLIRAIRAVSIERGRDPRQFALFSFGGMGPVQALDVADELGFSKVIVPPLPGLFSSLGLLFAQVEHHLIRTHYALIKGLDYDRVNAVVRQVLAEANATLDREGFDSAHRAIGLSADTRYEGQDYALTIPFGGSDFNPAMVGKLVEGFHREHERTYGYCSTEEEVQIVALRCLARGLSDETHVPERLTIAAAKGWRPGESRKCYFGPDRGWVETDVLGRDDLRGRRIAGPAIIEEDNALTVVLPRWTATLDEWSNIVLTPA